MKMSKDNYPHVVNVEENQLVEKSIKARVETMAKAIYSCFSRPCGDDNKYPWQEHGNSDKQVEARLYAEHAINAIGDYQKEEEYLKLHRENAALKLDAQLGWERARQKAKENEDLRKELMSLKYPKASRIEELFDDINKGDSSLPCPVTEENYRMSEDGKVIVISDVTWSSGDENHLDKQGKIYVYRKVNGLWVKEKEIYAITPVVNGFFSRHIVMAKDGHMLLIYDSVSGLLQVWKNVGEWKLIQKLDVKEIIAVLCPKYNTEKAFVQTYSKLIDGNDIYCIDFRSQGSLPSANFNQSFCYSGEITLEGLV